MMTSQYNISHHVNMFDADSPAVNQTVFYPPKVREMFNLTDRALV